MSRSKHRNPRSTTSGEWIEPGATRRPARPVARRPETAFGDADLATHLDLVATIGLLHSLFAAQAQND
jgi:hypothetical protein